MGIFSLTQELAIDLGTANTLIIYNGKVVVDEPSIVALDVHTGKLVAIGQQARQMHEKTNPNIKTIRPLKDGVIADFNATELMLRGMIKKVKTSGSLFAPSLRMVICIPSGSTNVEIRAVRDSAEHAGGREVYMIYEPMAAALGAGLDVEAPEGNMVIDIGGGTSEIACISLGGIVCSESINTAGDVFTNDIQSYVRQQHNIRIGERTAEAIKCSIGRRFGPGAGARGLRRDGSQHADRTAPDRVALVQRNRLRAGKVAHEDRRGADEGARIHAARAVRRHREERHLPRRRRRATGG
jgi:rod shape-determining protein MreB